MAFWKKIFKSKYTGAEIDAAVATAGNLPATTSADAGKALVVDEEGKIVTGDAGGGGAWTPDITITATLGTWGGDTKNYNSISAIDKTIEECQAALTSLNKRVLLNIDDEGYVDTYYMRVCGLSYDQQSEVTAFMLMPDPDYYGYTVLYINTDNLPLNTSIRVMTGSSGIGIFSWNFSNVPKDRYLAYGDLIFGNIKQPE